jgi:predicted metal-dependent enzyme (double-stranded beta helix superfamily)
MEQAMMIAAPDPIAPLRDFVVAMTHLVTRTAEESRLLSEGGSLLRSLIATDDWLPDFCSVPHADHYQQYLLHVDPLERFSVVSFVWGPGQRTPVHDHTVWGLVGMLRGAETARRFERSADGRVVECGTEHTLQVGDVDAVSPSVGDIHVVANRYADRPSISIHVYGANIGAVRRHVFDTASGAVRNFVSGYSSDRVPNLWDRSAAVRAAGS